MKLKTRPLSFAVLIQISKMYMLVQLAILKGEKHNTKQRAKAKRTRTYISLSENMEDGKIGR